MARDRTEIGQLAQFNQPISVSVILARFNYSKFMTSCTAGEAENVRQRERLPPLILLFHTRSCPASLIILFAPKNNVTLAFTNFASLALWRMLNWIIGTQAVRAARATHVSLHWGREFHSKSYHVNISVWKTRERATSWYNSQGNWILPRTIYSAFFFFQRFSNAILCLVMGESFGNQSPFYTT